MKFDIDFDFDIDIDIDIEVESALGIVAASFLKRELRYSKSPFKKIQRIARPKGKRHNNLKLSFMVLKINYLFLIFILLF